MHLHTLPKFFSKDHSPMSATDSPFPPLKTEHRYRGVYERAGFDVNLNGSGSDSSSMRNSPKSPVFRGSPQMAKNPQGSFYSQQARNVSTGSMPRTASGDKDSAQGRRNFSDTRLNQGTPKEASSPYAHLKTRGSGHSSDEVAHSTNYSHVSSGNLNPSGVNPSGVNPSGVNPSGVNPSGVNSSGVNSSGVESGNFGHANHNANNNSFGSNKPSADSSFGSSVNSGFNSKMYAKPFETEHVNPRVARESDSDRNKKNLTLHIPDAKSQHNSQETAGTSTSNSPFDTDRNERSSPSTSLGSHSDSKRPEPRQHVQASPYPVAGAERDLSDVLAGLKQDVADHRHYDPRGNPERYERSEAQRSDRNERSFESRNERSSESSEFVPSPEGQLPTENSNYQHFLHVGTKQRNPHLSTISSIISKPYDSEDDDEDDEIEIELKRQLESIKAGSSVSLESVMMPNSEESFVTACNVSAKFSETSTDPVPGFKVSAADKDDSEGSDTETEADASEPDEATPVVEPETPQLQRNRFDDSITYETPETIKPLSPKNHHIERELENLNFYHEPPTVAQEVSYTPASDNEDDILRQNPTPQEFEAFPRSVIDPKVPSFRTSEVQRSQAGTGPCRACAMPVTASAGPKKAIFSKTGELSGQWHRECFSCSYAGCSIQFNKSVTSYVLLDNPFCSHHYHTLNDTLCQSCHCGIEGECIENELKQKWHLACLSCTQCRRPIACDYFLIDGQIVCEADSERVIADMERKGLLTCEKVEKRRTRMLFID